MTTIPARSGKATHLRQSQKIKILLNAGKQVIDLWAFGNDSLASSAVAEQKERRQINLSTTEYMSMSATRAATLKLIPGIDDILYSNRRRGMLRLTEDTTPGVHDTLIAACNLERYRALGVPEGTYHDNCVDNMHVALHELGLEIIVADESKGESKWTPDPFNLFMNVPVHSENKDGWTLQFENSSAELGQWVVLEALMDVVVVMSACPQDMVPINDMRPKEATFEILD